MIVHRALLIQSLFALLIAADPQPKYPDWPALPPVPDVMPKPKVVVSVSTLGKDQLYVVQSDLPVQLLASPQGIVSITEEVGPLRIRGKFVYGSGKVETRTYEKKQVFLVERVAQGSVELLMVPKGDVVRRTITDDQNPIPPPKPIDPKPVDPPAPVAKSPWGNAPGLRVLIVYPEKGNLTAAQQPIITGAKVRNYLDTKCAQENGQPGYFIWKTGEDVSGTPATWQAAYKLADGKTNWIVIGNGDRWEQGPIPADADAALTLLKKYGDTFGGDK